MARKMTPTNGDGGGLGPVSGQHNVAARRAVLRTGFKELYAIDCDIRDETAKRIDGLKTARTRKWRQLKTDLDIDRQILGLDYKKFKLERDAENSDAGNGKVIDGFREIHEALAEGGMVDWVDALTLAAPPATPDPLDPERRGQGH